MDWLVRVGMVALVEGGVLPSGLSVAVDGTVRSSHARGRGHGLAGEEPETEEGEAADNRTEWSGHPTESKARYRRFSDPPAYFRWSKGSKSLEFWYLGLGLVVRTRDGEDLPLSSAFANVHEGEHRPRGTLHVFLTCLSGALVKQLVAASGCYTAAM